MRSQDEIQQTLKAELSKVSRQSFWLGMILGLLGGLALGFAIGYGQVETTLVVPLTQGIRT